MLRLSCWIILAGFHVVAISGSTFEAPSESHDLHVAYGDLSVSETTAILRIRLFSDDLAAALDIGDPDLVSADSAFLAYFRERFELRANGITLPPRLVGGGNDRLGSEPVSWYMLRFDAAGPIHSLHIANRVLLELFDDQRNLLNVVYVPTERRRVFYFAAEEEEVEFEVGN